MPRLLQTQDVSKSQALKSEVLDFVNDVLADITRLMVRVDLKDFLTHL